MKLQRTLTLIFSYFLKMLACLSISHLAKYHPSLHYIYFDVIEYLLVWLTSCCSCEQGADQLVSYSTVSELIWMHPICMITMLSCTIPLLYLQLLPNPLLPPPFLKEYVTKIKSKDFFLIVSLLKCLVAFGDCPQSQLILQLVLE